MKKLQLYNDKTKRGNTTRLDTQQPPRGYHPGEQVSSQIVRGSKLATLLNAFQKKHRITNSTGQLLMTYGSHEHKQIATLIKRWLQQDAPKQLISEQGKKAK